MPVWDRLLGLLDGEGNSGKEDGPEATGLVGQGVVVTGTVCGDSKKQRVCRDLGWSPGVGPRATLWWLEEAEVRGQ